MDAEKQSLSNYITVPQAAKYCGVSRNTMYTWVKDGRLPSSLTPGRTNKIRPDKLVTFMQECGMYVDAELMKRARTFGSPAFDQGAVVDDPQVLVVDDDPKNREVIRRAMPDLRMIEAETGFEALHLVTKFPEIRVVLLDLRMPGQHGLQTLKEIKRLLPVAKVLLITGYPGEVPPSLMENGMITDLIEKPFSVRLLADQVLKMVKESP